MTSTCSGTDRLEVLDQRRPRGLLERMGLDEFEQVVFCSDPASALRSIIAIHDTTLGPALGGIRMWPYESEEQALEDCLRLARGMTYKAAAAGLHLGGGKSVIIGDPATHKTEALLRAHGRFIQTLGGRYIPGIDVGTSQADLEIVAREAEIVSCIGRDPSYYTAVGVLEAIRAALEEADGSPELDGRRVAIQGTGHVGAYLARLLTVAGAQLVVADVERGRTEAVAREVGADIADPSEITSEPCDVFAPCALGGVVNDDSIARFACRAIAGAANNVLAERRHAAALAERGIVYAPDYVANSGGLVFLEEDLARRDDEHVERRVRSVRDRVRDVFKRAREAGITPVDAADRLAEERRRSLRLIGPPYVASTR
jgi:glutamate dehydrogenase/leucine dehydrogenase